MKQFYIKFLIIVLLLFAKFYSAQTKTYTQAMDSLLTYVDKTQMKTNLLYDRVFSFTDMDTSVKDSVNSEYFIQSWSELFRSQELPSYQSPDFIKSIAKESAKSNIIELGIINLKYDYLDFGSQTDPNLVLQNGYLRNVAGKNPFKQNVLRMMAPLSSNINDPSVSFSLRGDMIMQDPSLPAVTSISVDLDNGRGPINITVPSSTSRIPVLLPNVVYNTSGIKNIKTMVTFADASSQLFKSQINVIIPPNSSKSAGTYNEYEEFTGNNGIIPSQTVPFQGYGETVATGGILEYKTYYNTTINNGFDPQTRLFSVQPKINNPIYVLDGYDPGDTRRFKELFASFNYGDKNFINQLQDEGFDVTLVNFPNGADFIERNAMALVALLQRENAKLKQYGSDKKITLVGPSMGGMVSRYALAYMEKQGISHNTRLWVSYDAPHLGANIPISAQSNLYFYGFIGGNETAKTKYSENFLSPAAREMLIEQLDAANPMKGTGGQNNNDPVRKIFIQNLNSNGVAGSKGFPLQTRNIAISNGSGNSIKNVNDGQTLLEMAAFKKIFGFNFKAATLVDYAMPSYSANALNFEGKYTRKGWFTNGFIFEIQVLNTKVYRTNTNGNGSMDAVQGSNYNTMSIIKESFDEPLNQLTSFHEWRQGPFLHTFMPTVSTLAFKNSNFNWNDNIGRNLLCNNEIPFNTYYISSKNDTHVAFDTDIGAWLNEEILGNEQLPHFPINAVQFTGAPTICTNSTATYSFTDVCKVPGNASWTLSSNLQKISSTATSVVIKAIGSGSATITATFQNGNTFTKTIWIGTPKFYVSPDPNNTNYVRYSMISSDPDASVEQQGLSPTQVVWKRLDNGLTKTGFTYFYAGPPNYNWGFDVEVKATNACGSTTYITTITPPPPPLCDNYKIASTSNNRSAQTYKIIIDPCLKSQAQDNNTRNFQNNIEILNTVVTNIQGKVILQTKNSTFELSNQVPGTYYVTIVKNGKIVHKQTLIIN